MEEQRSPEERGWVERRHEWRRGTHECSSARRSGNDVNENAGLGGRGESWGLTALSTGAGVLGPHGGGGALGQSGQSPTFRWLSCFRGYVRYEDMRQRATAVFQPLNRSSR